jgi:2-succinyl-6-hydroxy-2,4-cyclohexadiene-1-carboxylate synthase
VALHVEVRGAGPPLALLHGFTQTGRLWGRFGDLLADSHMLVAVDLPGHGGSDSVRADLPTTASLVAEAVSTALGGTDEPCDVLGYSLGARVALHLATSGELPLRRVLFIGVTGGIEDPAERARRRSSDDALADELESSGDVEGFLRSWLRNPMFGRLSSTGAAEQAERLRNSAPGLASSLHLCGTGTQEPLWSQLPTLPYPVLAMAGADDARFVAHALRVARTAPHAVASLVPGGGHAAHLAQPEQVWRIVRHWLDAQGTQAAPVTGAGRR